MKKKKSLIAALLAAVMLVCTSALPLPAEAADAGGPYTVTVRLRDDIQITYEVVYPVGGLWSGAADIPIGGTSASSQVYCADPFVHFHGVAEWDGSNYSDTMAGYVEVAPWTVSGAMRLNEDAVRWLVVNGYRGDFFADDAASSQSVARLQGLYPAFGQNIDKTVALMATKIAIWKVVAGDGVVFKTTSLDGTPRGDALRQLVDALVADAASGRDTGVPSTEMTLEILHDDAAAGIPHGDGYIYYGPLHVEAAVENALPSADLSSVPLDGVRIDVMGENIEGIAVTSSTTATELAFADVFGTTEQAYALGGGRFDAAGHWASDSFYLRIPEARESADGLTVRARAKATDVPLLAGTPVTYVYADGAGVHNWNFVQGFTGGANDGVDADLYAEGTYATGTTTTGEIWVSKKVINGEYGDGGNSYTFELRMSDSQDFAASVPVDLERYNVYGALSVDKSTDTFTLGDGGLAYIDGLPVDSRFYWVVESGPGGGRAVESAIWNGVGYGNPAGNVSGVFQIDADTELAMVEFTNTYTIPKATFYIGKAAMEYVGEELSYTDSGDPYIFQLQSSADGGVNWAPVDMRGVTLHYDREPAVGNADGQFNINSTQKVSFSLNLPPDQPDLLYRVAEIGRDTDLMVGYAGEIIRAGGENHESLSGGGMTFAGEEHATDPISFGEEGGTCNIAFANVEYIPVLHKLSITKTVRGGTAGADGTMFPFTVAFTGDGDSVLPEPYIFPLSVTPSESAVLVTGSHITPERITNDAEGNPTVLWLADGETAHIMEIPAGNYEVKEGIVNGANGESYHTWYKIGANSREIYNLTAKVELVGDTVLTFVNEVQPVYTPPSSPNEPPSNPPSAPGPSPAFTPSPSPSPSPTPSSSPTPSPSLSPTPSSSPSVTPAGTPGVTPRPDGRTPGEEPPEEPGVTPARTPRVSPVRTPRIPDATPGESSNGESPLPTPVAPSGTPHASIEGTPAPSATAPHTPAEGTTVPSETTPAPSAGPEGTNIGDQGPGTGVPDISPAPDAGTAAERDTPDGAMPKTGGAGDRPEHAIPLLTGAVCLALVALYSRRDTKKRRG